VAFEEPRTQFVAEQTSTGLALQEGDKMILLCLGEHAFKDIVGRGEPLLSQLFPVGTDRRNS
jgi:hypothetical protein